MIVHIKSQKYPCSGVAISRRGGRSENQDNYGFMDTPLGFLVVVCDGMGGGPGGKTASAIVKYVMLNTLSESSLQASPEECLKKAVANAQMALIQKMIEQPNLKGMGSTLVALLFNEHSAWVIHLGDSRFYQLRERKTIFRSQDHSLVSELVMSKAITEEEARLSPQSNVITRGLGDMENHVPELIEIPYNKGDRFVLCTDGIWGAMPHDDLLLRITALQDMTTIVDKLSNEVEELGVSKGGHHDNYTIVMVEVHNNSKLTKMTKRAKLLLAAFAMALFLSLIANIFLLAKSSNHSYEEGLVKLKTEKEEMRKMYESIIDSLKRDSESANNIAKRYIAKNDSLDQLTKKLETKASVPQIAQPSQDVEQETISQITMKIKGLLNDFRNTQKKKIPDFIGKLYEIHKEILLLLDDMDIKTVGKFKSETNAIKNKFDCKSYEKMIDRPNKDGYYELTLKAKNKIDDIIKDIDQIQARI